MIECFNLITDWTLIFDRKISWRGQIAEINFRLSDSSYSILFSSSLWSTHLSSRLYARKLLMEFSKKLNWKLLSSVFFSFSVSVSLHWVPICHVVTSSKAFSWRHQNVEFLFPFKAEISDWSFKYQVGTVSTWRVIIVFKKRKPGKWDDLKKYNSRSHRFKVPRRALDLEAV